jgi:hypothetical protein
MYRAVMMSDFHSKSDGVTTFDAVVVSDAVTMLDAVICPALSRRVWFRRGMMLSQFPTLSGSPRLTTSETHDARCSRRPSHARHSISAAPKPTTV